MGKVELAAVLVAIVSAACAYLSQRAAAKASTINTKTTSRVDMEKEAYERARSYDTGTIERQDHEIEELREENRELRTKVQHLEDENRTQRIELSALQAKSASQSNEVETLQRRILRLERMLPPDTDQEGHTHDPSH